MMAEQERRLLAAAMDRILPGGAGPGATDANAIGLVDWYLSRDELRRQAADYSTGLALLDELARIRCGRGFLDCDGEEKDAILEAVRAVPHPTVQRFFANLIGITLAGFLCAPRYGGNRGGVGWRYIGFTPDPQPAEVREWVEPLP